MTESPRTVADGITLERRPTGGFVGHAGNRPHVLAVPLRGRLAAASGGKR